MWRVEVGATPQARELATCAVRFLAELAVCVPGVDPFTARVIAEPDHHRPAGSLPLWLEPDLDYTERVVRVDPAELDDGLPTSVVLLHELTHLFLAALLRPKRQVAWLAEAVCDYLPGPSPGIPCSPWFLSAIHNCLVASMLTCVTRTMSRTVPRISIG